MLYKNGKVEKLYLIKYPVSRSKGYKYAASKKNKYQYKVIKADSEELAISKSHNEKIIEIKEINTSNFTLEQVAKLTNRYEFFEKHKKYNKWHGLEIDQWKNLDLK